ncbi:patatin-like phospholipase family protein [Alkalihalobacillus sp. LMS6]|uniref:patatin-like phospholipase family protein n=1 Tax=Bacillaceae TaxID=186817 RepID=UPI000C070D0C|nr:MULTISPECIES: patatin-like phospholipase family protein [Bacillaceae]UTR04968.1 patatin-like phospholipase family protein [Alkalihalobacillus sp. LMS6]
MKVDAVFAGGGVKAFAFVGAIEEAEQSGLEFERIAGTSAGSIVAAFLMAGYTSEEINHLLNSLDVSTFRDERLAFVPLKIAKWLNLYFRMGLYKGDRLEEWLKEQLHQKGVATFNDLPPGSLRIVVSDVTRGQMVVLPDDLPKYGLDPNRFSVATAVRMSCSIPFFFEPVKLKSLMVGNNSSYIVDGGLLSNFPMWIFKDGKRGGYRRPVIGFQLAPQNGDKHGNDIHNALDLYKAIFETMTHAHDARYISSEHAKNIVFIPIDHIKSTDFDVTIEEKQTMIDLGKEKTAQFLASWTG